MYPPRRTPAITLPVTARLGHLGEAVELFRKNQLVPAWNSTCEAIIARPFHPEAWLLLAEIAQAALQPELSRDCFARVRELTPKWKKLQQFGKSSPPKGRARIELPPLPQALQCNPPFSSIPVRSRG